MIREDKQQRKQVEESPALERDRIRVHPQFSTLVAHKWRLRWAVSLNLDVEHRSPASSLGNLVAACG